MCRTPLGLICTVWRPSWRMYPARAGQGLHTRDSSRKVRRYVQCTAGLKPCLVRQVGTANPTQLTLHQGVPSVCSVRMRGAPRLAGSDWPPTGRNPPDPSSQTTSLARAWRGSQAKCLTPRPPRHCPWIPGESSKLDKLSSPQSMTGINHGMGSRSSENVMTSTAHHSPCRRQPAAWSRFRQSMLDFRLSALGEIRRHSPFWAQPRPVPQPSLAGRLRSVSR